MRFGKKTKHPPQFLQVLLFFFIFVRMNKSFLVYLFCSITGINSIFAQLIANAGANKNICPNRTQTLGGSPSASGGVQPYSYSWQPSSFLNSTTVSNPVATNISGSIEYTLTVTDKNGNTASSTVVFFVDPINTFDAGIDTGFCVGQQNGITIGNPNNGTNNSNHTFTWLPATGLDNPNAPNPLATPTITTQYKLTVSNGGFCESRNTFVTVTPFQKPYVDASPDTVIDEGNTITLNGIGAVIYYWRPDYHIKYGSTPNADVWPIVSTTYTLYTEDAHKCFNFDTVRVDVINGDKLFFYSAFTPNGDGDNDFFYIGNLEKFPDNNLKIYNRYGKLIYSATNYANDWDGTYLGNQIPTGTYFYIFSDGLEKKYKGSVTILR